MPICPATLELILPLYLPTPACDSHLSCSTEVTLNDPARTDTHWLCKSVPSFAWSYCPFSPISIHSKNEEEADRPSLHHHLSMLHWFHAAATPGKKQ